MKFYALSACLFATFLLAGCTYVEPFYLLNDTSSDITIRLENEVILLKPGKTKKIRGLHYVGATIERPEGDTQSYTSSLRDMVKNHSEYLDRYICARIWGSRVDLKFTKNGDLEMLPCNQNDEVRLLVPD